MDSPAAPAAEASGSPELASPGDATIASPFSPPAEDFTDSAPLSPGDDIIVSPAAPPVEDSADSEPLPAGGAISGSPVPHGVGSDPTGDHDTSPAHSSRAPLPDVVETLGVRFERWEKNKISGSARPLEDDEAGASVGSAASRGGAVQPRVLLYLPGIEGLGTSVEPQLPGLASKFDVFRMVVDASDRSTFLTLSKAVCAFADDAARGAAEEKLVVVGESFGGMLALRLAQLR